MAKEVDSKQWPMPYHAVWAVLFLCAWTRSGDQATER